MTLSMIDNKMAGNVVTKFATTLQSTIAYRMKMVCVYVNKKI